MISEISPQKKHDLRVIRAYFLIMIGGMGAAGPFLNITMSRQNLNGAQIGLVISIGSVIGLFSAPYWTKVQTENPHPIRMLSLSLFFSGLATVLFGYQVSFIGIAVFYALRMLFNASHLTTADMLALKVIRGTNIGYGSIRYLGSVGWVIIVLFTGWLNEKTSIRSGFFLYFFFNLLSIFLLTRLIDKDNETQKSAHTKTSQYFSGILELLKNPLLSGLGIMIILTGIGNAGVLNYELIYLDQLGASESVIGIAGMAGAFVEVPTMIYSDRIAKRIGTRRMILAAMIIYIVLRCAVIFFPSILIVILARGLGGIAYSFLTIAQVMVINEVLPSEASGTALVIFTVTIPTLISIVLMPVFGSIMDLAGTGWLYGISLVGYALGWIVYKRLRA